MIPSWRFGWPRRSRSSDLARRRTQHLVRYKSGRQALYAILKALRGERENMSVLLPAYCCEVVFDAFDWAGVRPVRYRVTDDLAPDLNDIDAKYDDTVAAVLAVHYFGFEQDLQALSAWCAERKLDLIEDAAHVDWLAENVSGAVGQYGDWLFSSLRKFCGVQDGAVAVRLKASDEHQDLDATRFLGGELRSAKNNALAIWSARRPPSIPARFEWPEEVPQDRSHGSSEQYVDHRFSAEQGTAMTFSSRLLHQWSPHPKASAARRANYQRIVRGAAGWRRATPLYSELEDTTTPYVVPLLLNYPTEDYPVIRAVGINALRWEDLATEACDVARRYEDELVQIPCHEGLSKRQLSFIEHTLATVFARSP